MVKQKTPSTWRASRGTAAWKLEFQIDDVSLDTTTAAILESDPAVPIYITL